MNAMLLTIAEVDAVQYTHGVKAWVYPAMHVSAVVVGVLAVFVMLWGVVRAALCFVAMGLRGRDEAQQASLRANLGYFILLGLELLIVADVIETITDPDLEHVLVLGLIVVIRTVISFSLNWELTQENKSNNKS